MLGCARSIVVQLLAAPPEVRAAQPRGGGVMMTVKEPKTRQALHICKIMPGRGGLNAFFAEVHRDIALWGVLSICSSVVLLLSYWCLKHVRRTPGWQFLYAALCDMYVAGGLVVISLAGADAPEGAPAADLEHLVCGEYGLLLLSILGFDVAANAWRLFMYVDLIVVYHNPFRPNTARPLYHVLVAGLVFSWLLAVSSSDVLCSSSSEDGGGQVNVLTLTWGLVYGPFLLFVLLGGALYLAVKALLSRDNASKRISRLARQRVRARKAPSLCPPGPLSSGARSPNQPASPTYRPLARAAAAARAWALP